ncbi:MAG TPA: DUF1553 domain-containing protein [Pirellulales bacterium]|jgi:hypothetical protein|nr:DUF1553 domain-containing protein [Pirellulales bacterium]
MLRVAAFAPLAWILACLPAAAAPSKLDFDRDIHPILSDKCFKCHGPDAHERQAGLRLDLRDAALRPAESGQPAIVPGNASASVLVERVLSTDADQQMPPPDSNKKLTDAQKQLLKAWVEQGAPYAKHWSLVPPKRPALPEVAHQKWSAGPIDRFILARLESAGLAPSPEADRPTLLRRLSLDLTGLPPTPAEVDAFVADQRPDAYARQVDRLLASPHYGERMALEWLDAARYADTHGYHIDSHRDMWPWRDWVIEAFNRNQPFDQFTVEQLAGDLLPGATLSQQVASGFNRNHMINFEGGAIAEEYLAAYIVDRVNTTGTVWLGMTVGCAQCHDHKFDPITQRDYYRLYAFFHNVPENGLDGRKGNAAPLLKVPNTATQKQLSPLRARAVELESALAQRIKAADAEFKSWSGKQIASPEAEPLPLAGLAAHYPVDARGNDETPNRSAGKHPGRLHGDRTHEAGRIGLALALDANGWIELGQPIAVERDRPFTVAAWVKRTEDGSMTIAGATDGKAKGRGWEFSLARGGASIRLSAGGDDFLQVQTRQQPIPLNRWQHVAVVYDGSGKLSGLKLYVGGKEPDVYTKGDKLAATIHTDKPVEVGRRAGTPNFQGSLDDLRFYNRALSELEVSQVAGYADVLDALALKPEKRTPRHRELLHGYYFAQRDEPSRKLNAQLADVRRQEQTLLESSPTAMVMQDLPQPRETFMLVRGQYDKHGAKVASGVPESFSPLPAGAPSNRLGLARWLVAADQPLTARVIVNRWWQMYFGTGLVKTSEDFGSQGEYPSHPELLDWLACQLRDSGWNVKAMQRLIVMSAAYRQASVVSPQLVAKDPENRLLARGPRVRLPAELIRDQALAASGLLNDSIGGPSVFPYQPDGLWDELAYGGTYSAQKYTPSHGRDLYRRTMYTFWKRTVPPPSLATFDAPDRETCTVRRLRTNTPLQALVLMNDPTYVEASRKLAERIVREGGSSPVDRVAYAFRLTTARRPTSEEAAVLIKVFEHQLIKFRRTPTLADKLLSVGESKPDATLDRAELAAWSVVASMLLNLDETVTKG